jgi:hypothetical protein
MHKGLDAAAEKHRAAELRHIRQFAGEASTRKNPAVITRVVLWRALWWDALRKGKEIIKCHTQK